MTFSNLLRAFVLMLCMVVGAEAQTAVPYVFDKNIPIPQLNANFASLGTDALKRSGGILTGNITASDGVTIDGVDISAILQPGAVTISSTSPYLSLIDSNGGTNAKKTRLTQDVDYFQIFFINDDDSFGSNPFYIHRTGSTGDLIALNVAEVVNPGRYSSATLQPGFLAYNSATDTGLGTGDNTVDLDTEIYDTANNFSGDIFTAPVTGVYEFCAGGYSTASGPMTWKIAFSTGAEFIIGTTNSTNLDYQASGCIHYPMSQGGQMLFRVNIGSAASTVNGGTTAGAGTATWMSGRLVP